jgi:hypothetical protein
MSEGGAMDKHRTARPNPSSSPITVRELLAWLQDKDPDFLVILDATSQTMRLINARPGFCSHLELEEEKRCYASEYDQRFLRDLRIMND